MWGGSYGTSLVIVSIRSTEEVLGVWEEDYLQNSHQNEGRVNPWDRRQGPWAMPGPTGAS